MNSYHKLRAEHGNTCVTANNLKKPKKGNKTNIFQAVIKLFRRRELNGILFETEIKKANTTLANKRADDKPVRQLFLRTQNTRY